MATDFEKFPKIPRLKRGIVVTEKIDGTNAQVCIEPCSPGELPASWHISNGEMIMRAGSRNQWIEPGRDNYGFAAWVLENHVELFKLGQGRHFGEWWGCGIQRGYGLTEKRFSLFNNFRWSQVPEEHMPNCVHVVPQLYAGPFTDQAIDECIGTLMSNGSEAAPSFMNPEGVVIWHQASRSMFKRTLLNDEAPKGQTDEATID